MTLYGLEISSSVLDLVDKHCVVDFIMDSIKLFGDKYNYLCNYCKYDSERGCVRNKYRGFS